MSPGYMFESRQESSKAPSKRNTPVPVCAPTLIPEDPVNTWFYELPAVSKACVGGEQEWYNDETT